MWLAASQREHGADAPPHSEKSTMGNNQTKNNPIMGAGGTASVGMSLGEIEKWIDEDLKRSGLSREDIEVEPFVGESFMNQSVNGYKIRFSGITIPVLTWLFPQEGFKMNPNHGESRLKSTKINEGAWKIIIMVLS